MVGGAGSSGHRLGEGGRCTSRQWWWVEPGAEASLCRGVSRQRWWESGARLLLSLLQRS